MSTETPPQQPRRKPLRAELRNWPQHPEFMLYVLLPLIALFFVVIIVLPWREPEMTPRLQARDAAAIERAQARLQALGFEPGPAVCRTVGTGSDWCTVRIAGTDKTFSLFCSYKHPTCVEEVQEVLELPGTPRYVIYRLWREGLLIRPTAGIYQAPGDEVRL